MRWEMKTLKNTNTNMHTQIQTLTAFKKTIKKQLNVHKKLFLVMEEK